jgi:3'(2'), 5'-bisphosphate nucleotidase
MSASYDRELDVAVRAVHLACLASKALLRSSHISSRPKADCSPVTVADYASQALLIASVRHGFPDDAILGEESAAELRQNPTLCDQVWNLVSETINGNRADAELSLGNQLNGRDDMLKCIDMGGEGLGGIRKRVWMLDPLDGTAAYTTGGQYAVSLALVEDGDQKVGVIGCPNLPLRDTAQEVSDNAADVDGYGCLLSAVRNRGSSVREMKADGLGSPRPIHHDNVETVRLIEPSNTAYDFEKHRQVAEELGAAWPGTRLWSSQMRFAALALGAGNVQIAIRRPRDYHSCVWDVAGGALIFEEAGGVVTDVEGNALDFQQGRRLEKNSGIIAALAGIHARVLATVGEVNRS